MDDTRAVRHQPSALVKSNQPPEFPWWLMAKGLVLLLVQRKRYAQLNHVPPDVSIRGHLGPVDRPLDRRRADRIQEWRHREIAGDPELVTNAERKSRGVVD